MAETTPTTIAHDTASSRRQAMKKPVSLRDLEPVTDIESYDAVPFYRKTWFTLVPLVAQSVFLIALTVAGVTTWLARFPLFASALLVIALTGDVYAKANFKKMKQYSDAEVWRYTAVVRALFVVVSLSHLAFFVTAIRG